MAVAAWQRETAQPMPPRMRTRLRLFLHPSHRQAYRSQGYVTEATAVSLMTERLSALVLDADPASLSTISETLAKFKFTVFPFQTAEAALDFIKRGAAKEAELDLVLVDANLNSMALGTSANSDLRHHILNELHVPLIAMCSCDDENALSKCMNLGACFHVLKPLDRRSFSILWHQAMDHKSKKAAPLNSTKNRMVSASTEKSKKVTILEKNDLSDRYEEPKKRNRITWTVDLHEKFLEAVEALGGDMYATPEAILHQMNIKGLTAKHIGSHLQKHRLRHQNAKQGGQCHENASRKRFPELIISAHDEATSESITPRVETDGQVYPSRLWTKMKKRSVDKVALKTDMYTSTSGNCREDTESVCVWDKYENKLQSMFSEKKKRWQFMSKQQWPRKNNIVITDEGHPNEAPESTGGASIEISGSCSLLPSNQVGANNHSEAARANDNVENITLVEAYRAYFRTSGSGSLLTGDQVRQKGYAEAIRDNDNSRSINLPQGYGAFTEISGSSNMLASNQVRENNHTEFARDNDHMEKINLLEGTMDLEYNASMDLHEPVTQGSQEQQNLGMEDLQQVDDIAWDDALISVGPINLLDEPMAEEAAVGGSQDQQSLALGVLQAGDIAWGDDMVNLFDEPIAEEAAIGDALMGDPVSPIAQDDMLWAWSPAVPTGDYASGLGK